MTTSDPYDVLLERFSFPGSARLRAILEMLMTPEEARLAEALPGTVEQVAERTAIPQEEVRRGLEELFFKGVVFPRGDFEQRSEYRLARHVLQLHDATLATQQLMVPTHKPFFKKWHEFCLEEMYPAMVAAYQSMVQPPSRVVPAYKAVQDLPDVLPQENFHELLRTQDQIAVVPCSCRYRTTSVGEPCDRHSETDQWACLQFGRGAEYVLARGSGRPLSAAEAIELADSVEDVGLIHIWTNSTATNRIYTSCQCCDDCCMNLVSARRTGASIDVMVQKSRFEAYVAHPERCDGCEECFERCPFDAIEMKNSPDGDIMTSSVSPEKCFGCGVCVVGCQTGAMKMRVVRPPEFIPDEMPAQQVAH